MFKIPPAFHYSGWFIGISRSWINYCNPQYIHGSLIPKLIINQQGWITATAQLYRFHWNKPEVRRYYPLKNRRAGTVRVQLAQQAKLKTLHLVSSVLIWRIPKMGAA